MEVRRPGTKFIVYQTGLKLASKDAAKVSGVCPVCGAPSQGGLCRVCELTGRVEI